MSTLTSKHRSSTSLTDPVCGMSVGRDSPHVTVHRGREYRFCSASCRERFVGDPQRFLAAASTGRAGPDAGAPSPAPAPASRRRSGRDYLPLFVLLALSGVVATALALGPANAVGDGGAAWMRGFMGYFLVTLSMFKLFDLSGFADGFQRYDLLARRFRPYAFVYPFVELGLGLGFLAAWPLGILEPLTIAVMGFGTLGVLDALRRRIDVNCACMGTVLKVPLSTVTLTEDLGMAAMAAMLWAGRAG
jgi:YHS domain-containing protein